MPSATLTWDKHLSAILEAIAAARIELDTKSYQALLNMVWLKTDEELGGTRPDRVGRK